jgi:hypothetical protein
MSTDTQVQDAAAGGIARPACTDDWWRGLSSDELRDIINRGFAGGELFTGATAEAERRSKEKRRAADEEAARSILQRKRASRKTLILRLLVVLSLVATFSTTLIVLTRLWAD